MRRKRWGDEGSATVCTVFAAAALCAVFLALMGLGQAVTARHRAGGAADLAALAAADRAVRGPAAACAAAGRVAAAQHTRLVRCAVSGPVADVSVEAGSGPFTTQSRARAGPAAQGTSAARTEAQWASAARSEAQGASPARSEAQGASPARSEAQGASPARSEAQGASPAGTPPQGRHPARPGATGAVPGRYGDAGGTLPARWVSGPGAARTTAPRTPNAHRTAHASPSPRPAHALAPAHRTARGPPASRPPARPPEYVHAPPPASFHPLREGTDRRTKSVGPAPHPTPNARRRRNGEQQARRCSRVRGRGRQRIGGQQARRRSRPRRAAKRNGEQPPRRRTRARGATPPPGDPARRPATPRPPSHPPATPLRPATPSACLKQAFSGRRGGVRRGGGWRRVCGGGRCRCRIWGTGCRTGSRPRTRRRRSRCGWR